MTRGSLALALLVLGLSVAEAQSRPAAGATEARSYRVLFVGNSYTRFHSMPLMVRAALRSLPHRPSVQVETVAHPGWTLERHLASGRPQQRIARGRFTHVVLQDHSLSAVSDSASLREAVRALHAASREAGARTVLYETWARREGAAQYERQDPATPDEMLARIGAAYGALGRETGAPVAPAGRAFAIARAEHPEIELYRADGSHPSEAGSYLVAVTLTGVVSGRDPAALRYVVPGVPRQEAATLRAIAARAIAAGP
ncbi:MAG: SGNH/GDSL hydrolase family protein [Deltaproteobacteria bacterium]